MQRSLAVAAAVAGATAVLLGGARLEAQTFSFDFPFNSGNPPAGYAGMTWTNIGAMNLPAIGYQPGQGLGCRVGAGNLCAYNKFGQPASFQLATPGTFTLGSFHMMAWADESNGPRTPDYQTPFDVTVRGFLGGAQLFSRTLALPGGPTPTLWSFAGWSGIDRVTFTSALDGQWWLMDELTVAFPSAPPPVVPPGPPAPPVGPPGVVPEPGTWALLVGGLALLVPVARRRRVA